MRKVIFDNIGFYLQKSGGLSIYWSELLNRVIKEKELEYEILERNEIPNNIFRKNLELIKVRKFSFLPLSIARYLPVILFSREKKIFHSSLYRFAWGVNVKNVTTVHDFTYEYYMKGISKVIHTFQKRIAIFFSDVIICISNNTKDDLIKFCPWVDSKKIRVVYNGVNENYKKIDKTNFECDNEALNEFLKEKFVLFVGHRTTYKNFDLVSKALNNNANYKLVIVGEKLNEKELDLLDGYNVDYFYAGRVTTNDLNILYNHAFALLYPSSYEGFGIPIIEAMRAGCPVIVNNSSSIPEVAEDAAIYLKSLTDKSILESLELLENADLRMKLQEKGYINVMRFSWDKTYAEMLEIYKGIE